MTKVVYNGNYGGFSLSTQVKNFIILYCEEECLDSSWIDEDFQCMNNRHHPALVAAVESLENVGDLTICEINSDKYYISDYDGWEVVMTPEDINWVSVAMPKPPSIFDIWKENNYVVNNNNN